MIDESVLATSLPHGLLCWRSWDRSYGATSLAPCCSLLALVRDLNTEAFRGAPSLRQSPSSIKVFNRGNFLSTLFNRLTVLSVALHLHESLSGRGFHADRAVSQTALHVGPVA